MKEEIDPKLRRNFSLLISLTALCIGLLIGKTSLLDWLGVGPVVDTAMLFASGVFCVVLGLTLKPNDAPQ